MIRPPRLTRLLLMTAAVAALLPAVDLDLVLVALAAARGRVLAGDIIAPLDLPPFGFSDRPGSYTRADQAARVNVPQRLTGRNV